MGLELHDRVQTPISLMYIFYKVVGFRRSGHICWAQGIDLCNLWIDDREGPVLATWPPLLKKDIHILMQLKLGNETFL